LINATSFKCAYVDENDVCLLEIEAGLLAYNKLFLRIRDSLMKMKLL